jgi:hypothetical protein
LLGCARPIYPALYSLISIQFLFQRNCSKFNWFVHFVPCRINNFANKRLIKKPSTHWSPEVHWTNWTSVRNSKQGCAKNATLQLLTSLTMSKQIQCPASSSAHCAHTWTDAQGDFASARTFEQS